jgi:hypothetical protein
MVSVYRNRQQLSASLLEIFAISKFGDALSTSDALFMFNTREAKPRNSRTVNNINTLGVLLDA